MRWCGRSSDTWISSLGVEIQRLGGTVTSAGKLKVIDRDHGVKIDYLVGRGEGNPYRPHTHTVPVEPGKIEEYVLRLYRFAATFQPGHSLVVELSTNEPLADAHNALLPPDAFHLPVGRPVTHKIYRDAAHPSRLVLPFTTVTATDATQSGSARDHEGDQLSGS